MNSKPIMSNKELLDNFSQLKIHISVEVKQTNIKDKKSNKKKNNKNNKSAKSTKNNKSAKSTKNNKKITTELKYELNVESTQIWEPSTSELIVSGDGEEYFLPAFNDLNREMTENLFPY